MEADSGFRSLVEDETGDQGAPSPAVKPAPTSAKPRTTAAASADAAMKDAGSSNTAGPAPADTVQQPVTTSPVVLARATGTTGGAGTQTAAACADGSAQPAAAALPVNPKARLGGPSIAQPTPDDLAEADEEAGGIGESSPAGAQAEGQAGAPAGLSAGAPASPTLAAGSAAQPLMAALGGAGATLVKAQAGSTGTGLRAAAGTPARGKGALAVSDLTGKASAALLIAAAPAEPPPVLLALADTPVQDDPGDDDATDEESAGADDAAAATAQSGFVPVAGAQAQSPSQAVNAATPMSASAADLAAQMAARVASGSSRFQIQLNPLGLGRVDVSVSISPGRQLTAALSFADPQTASALSAHAGELKTALEQAGFNVPVGGFDFTSGAAGALGASLQGGFSPGGGSGGDGSPQSGGGRMAAFSAGEALAATGANDATAWTASGDSRLDIRI